MSTLSSCYFCGTALDAPIDSYPVVPEEIPTDDEQTVSLCPTCQRKLHGILETALTSIEAVDSAGVTSEEFESHAEAVPDSDHDDTSTTATEADQDMEPSGTATPDDADAVAAEREPSTEIESDTTSEESDTAATESTDAGDAETATEKDTSDDETDSTADATAQSERVANEPSTTGAGEDPQAVSDGASESAATEAESTDSESDGETDETGGRPAILSTSAAKKVIRLLQNREFPVKRGEFEAVASNAYDIPQEDCVDVLDALVSEGYVSEKRGNLVREE